MAYREAAARKILPKTGDDVVDSEAIVVQACLARIHDNIATDAKTRHHPTRRYISGAVAGDVVDVTHRASMGAKFELESEDIDERQSLTERTDAIVAQSALLRLMRTIANGREKVDKQHARNELLERENAALKQRVAELEAVTQKQAAALDSQTDAAHCFTKYREAWRTEHITRQHILEQDFEVRRKLISNVLNRRAADHAASKLVRDRRTALNRGAAAAALEADRDFEIEAMMKGFAPLPATVVTDTLREAAAPEFQLKSLGTMKSLFGHDSSSMHFSSMLNPFASQEQHMIASLRGSLRGSPVDPELGPLVSSPGAADEPTRFDTREEIDESALDLLDDDFELVQKKEENDRERTPGEAEKGGAEAIHADELVITRFIGSSARAVNRLDPTATYIGVLINALRYAPGAYTVLTLDADVLAGRRAALARQAHASGIGSLWDAVSACHHPVVYIAQCDPPSNSNAAAEGRSKSTVEKQQQQQHPGIIAVMSKTETGEKVDLLNSHLVRCYASSSVGHCRVDALIQPFFDSHTPYFATHDAPGQFVEIVFEKIAIAPSGYSFACTHPIAGGAFPRCWRFEASLDGTTWHTLREHENDGTLTAYNPVGVWTINLTPGNYFSRFRLTHLGLNAVSTRQFNLCSFEVYGRAMYVRERAAVPASALPKVPRLLNNEPRRSLQFPLLDQMPPPPAPTKGKVVKKKR